MTEMQPKLAPPGVRRRYEHICDWLAAHEIEYSHEALLSFAVASKSSRVRKVLREFQNIDRKIPSDAVVLVLGLGAVHMLLLALYLRFASTTRRRVVYDTCDSWLLQVKARFGAGGLPLALPSVAGLVLQALVGRSLSISYISQRDQRSDRWVNLCGTVFIVGPSPSRVLLDTSNLNAVAGRIDRVCVSADYDAFHNEAGMKVLRDAWHSLNFAPSELGLHLYGQGVPIHIRGSVLKGWASNILDVYSGNSAVFIPNMGGSGVPNKLIDALAARRPVLIHKSASGGLEENPLVFIFEDDLELAKILQRLSDVDFTDLQLASIPAFSELPEWMADK